VLVAAAPDSAAQVSENGIRFVSQGEQPEDLQSPQNDVDFALRL
jgi:hypothetical protein